MKKVALCLHGLFDSNYDKSSKGLDGFEYIRKNILSKADVDVFIHSWEPHRKDEILGLYSPVDSVFESPVDFSSLVEERGLDSLQGSPRPPGTILSHFYSVQRALSLVKDGYDIVVKSRFDLGRINRNSSGPGHKNPFPVQCIAFNPYLDMSRMYVADWQYMDTDGPADMWFYSSPENMSHFTRLFDLLRDKYFFKDSEYAVSLGGQKGDIPNAIKLYKWFMMDVGLWGKITPLKTEWV